MKDPFQRLLRGALVPLLMCLLVVRPVDAKWNTGHVSFQGQLSSNGAPFTGTANFKFVILQGSGFSADVVWSNDGTAYTSLGTVVPPQASVPLGVNTGFFNVLLGASPMVAIDPAVMLAGSPTVPGTLMRLLIWVDTGSGFTALPAQTLSNTLYALMADAATRSVDRFTSSGDLLRTSGTQAVGIRQDGTGSWLTNLPNIGGFGNTSGGALSVAGSGGVHLTYGDLATRGLTLSTLGRIGIGTDAPQSLFDLVDRSTVGLAGTARSSLFCVTGPDLSSTAGSLVRLGNFGFHGGNNVSLAVVANRVATGSDWTTTSISMKLAVDNTDVVNGATLTIGANGNVGIGTTNPQAKFDVQGVTRTGSLEITGGADLAERFDVTGTSPGHDPTPGMVVCIDSKNPGGLRPSRQPFERQVVGVISGAGGINSGMVLGQAGSPAEGAHAVALSGRVYCLADAGAGPIEPGDLLTTSSIAGHAMKVVDYSQAQGAILGKAMSRLSRGRGLVLVLVSLQ